jgi:hypothetical protein
MQPMYVLYRKGQIFQYEFMILNKAVENVYNENIKSVAIAFFYIINLKIYFI